MAREVSPDRPPWNRGETPQANQVFPYTNYLLTQIKVRDLKFDALVHHVKEHCQ